jgi:hypothetical protein
LEPLILSGNRAFQGGFGFAEFGRLKLARASVV